VDCNLSVGWQNQWSLGPRLPPGLMTRAFIGTFDPTLRFYKFDELTSWERPKSWHRPRLRGDERYWFDLEV